MILLNRSIDEDSMANDFHSLTAKWRIRMEESDIPNPNVLERFRTIQIEQRKRLGSETWHGGVNTITWFKGARTNVFTNETKDPQKKLVIELVEKFLLDQRNPLVHNYTRE